MHPANPSTPNTEERDFAHHGDRAAGLYDQMGALAPFVWMMDWVVVYVLKLGLRAGFISPEFLMPSRPKVKPVMFTRNRQLRRARASCMKRLKRHALKGHSLKSKGINPEDYTPRAYAYYGYLDRMDKTTTPAQFNEHYLRGNNISRVQIYGMDSSHEIAGFVLGMRESLSGLFANIASLIGGSSLSFTAAKDPAPP